jgi:hypothetical protein
MKRSLLLILSLSVLVILPLLSMSVSGQNTTKDDDLSSKDLGTIFYYFVFILIAVVVAAVGVPIWINHQINGSKEVLEQKIDTKVREIKDDLEKQNTELKKGLQDKDERVRNLEITVGAKLGAVDTLIEVILKDINELKQNIREDIKELRKI